MPKKLKFNLPGYNEDGTGAGLVSPCTCGHPQGDHNLIYVTVFERDFVGMCHYCECENYKEAT